MAIAFARVSIHSRSHGQSAVAGSAYRSGTRLLDERTHEVHDYSQRHDVVYSAILLPEGADAKFQDRALLWNTVELAEKRKDAQVAKDFILALPKELERSQQIELARNFANYHFVSKGVVAELAIHDHGDGNPHAHIYVTTRRLHGNAFDRYKARDLNPTFASGKNGQFVSEQDYWGEQWRDYQNAYFADHALPLVVDENHLIPDRHEGRIRGNEAHYLREENALKRELVQEIALTDPDSLLNLIALRYAVFSERELHNLLFKTTQNAEQFQTALLQIKHHPEVMALGTGEDGQLRFTVRANYWKEAQMAEQAERLNKQRQHALKAPVIEAAIRQFHLTPEQAQALNHITTQADMAAIVGRAGTGKSYLLKAANQVWREAEFDVLGVTVSGIAAKGLTEASSIPATTLARFKAELLHETRVLTPKHVVVMDEAGMANLHDMALVVDAVQQAGAKLVLVGDPEQLQPIGAGAPFRALTEQIGFAEMQAIQRQMDSGDRAASAALALGDIEQAWQHYEAKGAIHWSMQREASFQALIADWSAGLTSGETLANQLILAHRNTDVADLNQLARTALIERGLLETRQQQIFTISKRQVAADGWSSIKVESTIALSVGDHLLFRENNQKLGVYNGEFGQVTAMDGQQLTVLLDNRKTVTFDTKTYQEFDYGYAATIHKAQGITKDQVFIYAGGSGWDKHLAYTALTRHRHNLRLYLDQGSFHSPEKAQEQFKRTRLKDNVLDWPLAYGERRGFEGEGLLKRLMHQARASLQDCWEWARGKAIDAVKHETLADKLKIDWTTSRYQADWERLRSLKQPRVEMLINFYDLLKQKQPSLSTQKRIEAAMANLVHKLITDKPLFAAMQKQAPELSQAFSTWLKQRVFEKGRSQPKER